ncbi:MAG: galactose mutarotase [Cytophagaceae bacterium]|jgi:aldose 1-epimerase|nr:galactose mutarotase [Cytophagaceae bacterium]
MKIEHTTSMLSTGENLYHFKLENKAGTTVKITNVGATITSIRTADKNGEFEEITLGLETPEEYLSPEYIANNPCLGGTPGRFANRIANGEFTLDGKTYKLAANNGKNHLHGGIINFSRKIWDAKIVGEGENRKLQLSLKSPDMDEGYPGNLDVTITYNLTDDNELVISYYAETDEPTIVNLTNHTYFNLNGLKENILNHEVMINADNYTESVENIPTGVIASVKGTPFDFMTFRKIGERLNDLAEDAYDHNYVLNGNGSLARAAVAKDTESGRTLEVFTTSPGMQFYTAYYLDGAHGRGNKKYGRFDGFCFETQYFPDSPNKLNFPSPVVRPNESFRHTTVFKFNADKF